MAHFTILDSENIVTSIIVVDNSVITDESGNEVEQLGKDYLENLLGAGHYVQTSYNGTFRKHYAGIGCTYDESKDAFIAPKLYPSWTLTEETCLWDAPIARPDDDKRYEWNEDTTSWDLISDGWKE